jgi:hypothetical protein
LGNGDANTGVVANTFFNSLNAASACDVQMNLSVFFINSYKGKAFSSNRVTNQLRDAKHPVNFCTSFRVWDNSILSTA